jgi:hypothetical protein
MPKGARTDRDDETNAPGAAGKAGRRLGIATVARPCLVGAFVLSVLHALAH